MSIKVLAWKTVLSCSFFLFFFQVFAFIHLLCHAAVAIMAVRSASFHQASPPLLQQPFFSHLCAVCYRLLSPLPFHMSICLLRSFLNLIFYQFFCHPALVWDKKCCWFKPNAAGGGCLPICLPYTWIKEQHCFHCTVHTKQRGFKAAHVVPKTQTTYRLHSVVMFCFSYDKTASVRETNFELNEKSIKIHYLSNTRTSSLRLFIHFCNRFFSSVSIMIAMLICFTFYSGQVLLKHFTYSLCCINSCTKRNTAESFLKILMCNSAFNSFL